MEGIIVLFLIYILFSAVSFLWPVLLLGGAFAGGFVLYRYVKENAPIWEEERRRKRELAEEQRFRAAEEKWEESYKVYVESEVLKGATQEEAEAFAKSMLGESPAEIRAKERAEARRREEEQRISDHNKEILAARAKLDAEQRQRRIDEAYAAGHAEAESFVYGSGSTASSASSSSWGSTSGSDYARVSGSDGWNAENSGPTGRFAWLDEYLIDAPSGTRDALPGNQWWRYSTEGQVYAVLFISDPDEDGVADDAANTRNLLTVRCEPSLMDYLHSAYTGLISSDLIDGCNWVVIDLDGDATDALVRVLCDRSCELALESIM